MDDSKKKLTEQHRQASRTQLEKLRPDSPARKQQDEQILIANERLQYLLSATSAVIYTAKTSGDYGATFISDNVIKITGYKPQNFIDKPHFWIDHVHPEDRQRILSELPRIFEQESYKYEYRFLHKNGTYIWMRDEMKLVRNKQGKPLEIIGYWIDITEQKQSEKALQESEQQYRAVFEQAADAVLLIDTETGALVDFNDKSCKTLGYTKEELRKLRISDFEVIESAEEVAAHIGKIAREGSDVFETRQRTKNGRIRDILVSTRAVSIGGKSFLQCIWRDITEQKKAEQIRAEERNLLRSLIDNLPDAIYIKDTKGRFIIGNTEFAHRKGVKTPDELVGKTDFDFYPQELASKYYADEQQIIRTGQPLVNKEEQVINQTTGETIWSLATKIPWRDSYGNTVGIMGVGRNITERKKVEETLRESEKLAAKGRAVMQIVHEVNNPLAGIENSLLLIKDAVLKDHPYYRYLDLIDREIKRISQTVRQMFDLYRPSETTINEFSVDKAVREVVTLLKVSCSDYNAAVDIKGTAEQSIVRLSEALLRQVLYDIIKNAIEASPPGGLVEITPMITEDTLTITVRDQGSGIPEQVQPHIFEPSFTTKKGLKTSGLGMGLTVSKHIVEEMGGRLEFESKTGEGTVFSIIIPLGKTGKETQND